MEKFSIRNFIVSAFGCVFIQTNRIYIFTLQNKHSTIPVWHEARTYYLEPKLQQDAICTDGLGKGCQRILFVGFEYIYLENVMVMIQISYALKRKFYKPHICSLWNLTNLLSCKTTCVLCNCLFSYVH